jgi:hypothetical protein
MLLSASEINAVKSHEVSYGDLEAHISDKKIESWINHLWQNIAKGHFHQVYHMMTKDYKMLRPDGAVFNRKQAIQFFKDLHIVEVQDLSQLFVVKGKDTISAYYIRPQRLEGSTEFVSYPVITTFQKVDGKWKWKAEPRSASLPF